MPYFLVEDLMWSHPKFEGLSDKALALWVRAGSYSSYYLTDGVITVQALKILEATKRACSELVVAGLWDEVADGGYRFHEWEHRNKTREYWEKKRAGDRARQANKRKNVGRNPTTGQFTKRAEEPPHDIDF